MKKRAVCLYRVSTKGQLLENQDDIPMQKTACRRYADEHGFDVIKEFQELGVSGFKVSAKKRDALQYIRQMALDKKFDVLLVFMVDRIGRIASESSELVEWFIDQGIEVWSTTEGQRRIVTHADRLTNYISFWQAEGESRKTSERMKEKQSQMLDSCEWRGGTIPYGYMLVPNGRIGKKNRLMNDLVKCPDAGMLVDLLWEFTLSKGYGSHRLANYLNEAYPAEKYPFSKLWTPQSIRSLLRNPIYKGCYRLNGKLSPENEAWRYVSDAEWERAQIVLQLRIPRKYPMERAKENTGVPEGMRKTQIFGASLLSGILYCGHCGHKLVGTYHSRELKGASGKDFYHRPIYRCYANANKAKGCTGLSIYAAERIETPVLKAVRSYFEGFSNDVEKLWKKQTHTKLRQQQAGSLQAARDAHEKLTAQREKLKGEVMKSIMGEGTFDPAMIQEMLAQNEESIRKAAQQVQEQEQALASVDTHIKTLADQFEHISDWALVFDEAPPDEKKMILSRMIERIEVRRDYHITIRFYIAVNDFREAIEKSRESGYNVVIEESEVSTLARAI